MLPSRPCNASSQVGMRFACAASRGPHGPVGTAAPVVVATFLLILPPAPLFIDGSSASMGVFCRTDASASRLFIINLRNATAQVRVKRSGGAFLSGARNLLTAEHVALGSRGVALAPLERLALDTGAAAREATRVEKHVP